MFDWLSWLIDLIDWFDLIDGFDWLIWTIDWFDWLVWLIDLIWLIYLIDWFDWWIWKIDWFDWNDLLIRLGRALKLDYLLVSGSKTKTNLCLVCLAQKIKWLWQIFNQTDLQQIYDLMSVEYQVVLENKWRGQRSDYMLNEDITYIPHYRNIEGR